MTWHLVTVDFPPRDGGVSTWSHGVAMALLAEGEQVLVHTREQVAGEPFATVQMLGRSWSRWGHWWSAASVVPRLRRGDRVIAATWPLATRLLGATRRLGVPLFVGWHGSDLTKPPLTPGIDAVKASAIHVPVSDYLGRLLGVPYTVLPCPIDPVAVVPRGERLLVVARLGPLKGVDRALRLARRLGRPITIVGEGPARELLQALALDLGVDATFTGHLPPDRIPWAGTWALVLLSRADDHLYFAAWPTPSGGAGQEGLGLVLLEAAARGVPSIGVPVGGIPEAATVVIHDLDHDPIPEFPSAEVVQEALRSRHGSRRTVAVLRRLVELHTAAD